MDGQISFNTNSLQTFDPSTRVGIITNSIKHTDSPDALYTMLQIANANKSVMGDIDSPSKAVVIKGVIKGSSQTDLAERVDAFKGLFNGKDKNLDIGYAGGTRRYIATAPPNAVKVDMDGGALLWAPFTVSFICTEAFAVDTELTTLFSVANHTTGSYNTTPTVGGNAPFQLPIITITIDALTGTGDYIQISNDANNQALLLFGNGLTAGDVIKIDCVKREATINDVLVDHDGTFLELEPGAASLTYSDGFTTRTVDIEAKYYKRWL